MNQANVKNAISEKPVSAIREVTEYGDYEDVLSVARWTLSNMSPQRKITYRESLLNEFLHTNYDLPQAGHGDVLFLRSLPRRDDYKALFQKVIKASGCENPVIAEDYVRPDRTLNIAASKFMTSHMDLLDKVDVQDPIDRSVCFLMLMQYGFILEHYGDIKLKALICFADMQPVETLFALYFRRRGVPTVTLQHGLYVDYQGMRTINAINYKVSPSQYFLAWGKNTADLISQNHPDTEIVICGKPDTYFPEPAANRKVAPHVFVILDQQLFDTQNRAMLHLAQAYAKKQKMELRVRFHPSNDRTKIFADYPMVKEDLYFLNAECVLGHTSSLLYEAMALGCKVYRFETEVPAVPVPAAVAFQSLDDLEKKTAEPYPDILWKTYFSAIGEVSIEKYRVFFRHLFDGTLTKEHRGAPTIVRARAAGQDRVTCVAIPCLPSDLSNLWRMFAIWSDERFAPALTEDLNNPALMIVFNNANATILAQAREITADFPALNAMFSDISIQSADLTGDRDLYIKTQEMKKHGAFGNKSGPNFLFQEVINRSAAYGGHVFQAELDCFPLVPNWVARLNQLIDRNRGSWVIGSSFAGRSGLGVRMKSHLNGNALYRAGDPAFSEFLNTIWIPRILDLSDGYPNLAYDGWWAIETNLADPKDGNLSWELLRKYASFIRNEPFIINLLDGGTFGADFSETHALYSDLGKPPLFVHSPRAIPAYEAALPVAEADVVTLLSELKAE